MTPYTPAVVGLSDALEVGKAERVERLDVVPVELQLVLQPEDLGLRVAGGEALRELGRHRLRQHVGRSSRRARAEHAAEEEGGGGEDRRRPAQDEAIRHRYECIGEVVPCVAA